MLHVSLLRYRFPTHTIVGIILWKTIVSRGTASTPVITLGIILLLHLVSITRWLLLSVAIMTCAFLMVGERRLFLHRARNCTWPHDGHILFSIIGIVSELLARWIATIWLVSWGQWLCIIQIVVSHAGTLMSGRCLQVWFRNAELVSLHSSGSLVRRGSQRGRVSFRFHISCGEICLLRIVAEARESIIAVLWLGFWDRGLVEKFSICHRLGLLLLLSISTLVKHVAWVRARSTKSTSCFQIFDHCLIVV